jgi:hypothetical protein
MEDRSNTSHAQKSMTDDKSSSVSFEVPSTKQNKKSLLDLLQYPRSQSTLLEEDNSGASVFQFEAMSLESKVPYVLIRQSSCNLEEKEDSNYMSVATEVQTSSFQGTLQTFSCQNSMVRNIVFTVFLF